MTQPEALATVRVAATDILRDPHLYDMRALALARFVLKVTKILKYSAACKCEYCKALQQCAKEIKGE